MHPHPRPDELRTLAELHATCFGEEADVVPMRGDGSARRIYRLHGARHTTIGIAGDNIPENDAFIGFTTAFRDAGLPVPEIYAVAPGRHCYLEEDLGDTTLFAWLEHERAGGDEFPDAAVRYYGNVLADLVRFQIDGGMHVDYTLCYQTDDFAEAAMRADLRYFADMFLARYRPDLVDETRLEVDTARLVAALLGADRTHFLYRDFQSRNVMVTAGGPRYIDYQSGRRGAQAYDVASLLYDAKARVPQSVRDMLVDDYLEVCSTHAALRGIAFDRGRFADLYPAYAIMRVVQALGAFGNLGGRQGKPGFLSAIPPALDNLAVLCDRAPILTDLPWLRAVFVELAHDDELHSITETP
jgi:aminoglycoside/choline kinase family phosphotransferase